MKTALKKKVFGLVRDPEVENPWTIACKGGTNGFFYFCRSALLNNFSRTKEAVFGDETSMCPLSDIITKATVENNWFPDKPILLALLITVGDS